MIRASQFRFVALSRVYHTRQGKNTPDKSEILGLRFLFNVGWRMTTKNPQTKWSGDVVEHCQQQSNL